MPLPVLYSFRRCPYAMRARLAIEASGVAVEEREIELKSKPPAMLEASPKGTVPVLVLPDGQVIDESWNIMRWALQKNDPQAWLPSSAQVEELTRQLVAENDGPFKRALDRYKYPHRYGLADGVSFRTEGATFMAQLNTRLVEQAYLTGPRWSLADAAIAPFVRQFAHTDKNWFAAQPWGTLQRWLAQFENSPAFASIMQKRPIFDPAKPPIRPATAPSPPRTPA